MVLKYYSFTMYVFARKLLKGHDCRQIQNFVTLKKLLLKLRFAYCESERDVYSFFSQTLNILILYVHYYRL